MLDAKGLNGLIECETLWISDTHLGNVHSKADYLLAFLKRVRCKRLYLVGDIVDVWSMHKRMYWPEAHNAILRRLLKMSRAGVEIIYIPGNHDMNFREFCGESFGNVKIVKEAVHTTADGRRFLVTHGDELDFAVRYSRMNRWIGDAAYSLLMMASRLCNKWRALTGRNYWSLSSWMETQVVHAEQAIDAYQDAAVTMGREAGYDGIICGHLHHPVVQQYEDFLYCNDGDWVESCTALIEDRYGVLHLVHPVEESDMALPRLQIAA